METTTATRPQQEIRTGPATLALICTGYFMVILDATVTNVALPARPWSAPGQRGG